MTATTYSLMDEYGTDSQRLAKAQARWLELNIVSWMITSRLSVLGSGLTLMKRGLG